jgi:hypothetical protein
VTPTLGDLIRADQEAQRERLNEQRESADAGNLNTAFKSNLVEAGDCNATLQSKPVDPGNCQVTGKSKPDDAGDLVVATKSKSARDPP